MARWITLRRNVDRRKLANLAREREPAIDFRYGRIPGAPDLTGDTLAACTPIIRVQDTHFLYLWAQTSTPGAMNVTKTKHAI